MLHIQEEKFKLKHPKSSEVKHLSVHFCVTMQLVCLRDDCLHQLLSSKDCTRKEHRGFVQVHVVEMCTEKQGSVTTRCLSENTTATQSLLLLKHGLEPQAVSADGAGQHIVSPLAL